MAQWVRAPAALAKGPAFRSWHTHEIAYIAMYVCNPSTVKDRDHCGFLVSNLDPGLVETLTQKNEIKSDRAEYLMHLRVHTHTRIHTCTHT